MKNAVFEKKGHIRVAARSFRQEILLSSRRALLVYSTNCSPKAMAGIAEVKRM